MRRNALMWGSRLAVGAAMFLAATDALAVNPVGQLRPYGDSNVITLAWQNPTNSNFSGVLVLRSTIAAPVGVPTNGSSYTAGGNIAGDLVAYAGPGAVAAPGSNSWWGDTTVTSGVTYYYAVYAYDTPRNYSAGSFTNQAAIDDVAPSALASLTAHEGDRRVPLTWFNSPEADFNGVLILRRTGTQPVALPTRGVSYVAGTNIGGDQVVYSGPGDDPVTNAYSGWIDTGLLAGTTYWYSVFAMDEVPNYSSPSYAAEAPPATNGVLYVDHDAPGANNGNSWYNAMTNLQAAITNVGPLGREVWIASGTYYPTPTTTNRMARFTLTPGLELYGGFAGTEQSLSERMWTNSPTILSGDINRSGTLDPGDSASGVVFADTVPGALLDGLTIQHGYGEIAPRSGQYAGGIYLMNCDTIVRNCVIRNCGAALGSTRAGGMGVYGASSLNRVTIANCLFFGNSAGKGGAMAIYHNQTGQTRTRIISSTFHGNNGGAYGAIYISNGGDLDAENCIFWDTGTSEGGGIYVKYPARGDTLNFAYRASMNFCDVNGGWTPPPGYGDGTDNLNVDPQFTNAPAFDYNLSPGSPCIDTGTVAVAADIPQNDGNNNSRVYPDDEGSEGRIDIGAFEWPPHRWHGPPQGFVIEVR